MGGSFEDDIVGYIGLAFFFGLVIFLILHVVLWKRRYDRKCQKKGTFIDDIGTASTIVNRNAIIVKKHVAMAKAGSAQDPYHEVKYVIKARFDDGEEKAYFVDEDSFNQIPENCNITLTIKDDELIDFKI